MAAQKRNYIDLVEDRREERRSAEVRPAFIRPIKDYLLDLLAAMRSARGGTK